jgi:uncharacterized membrane protein YccC
VPAEGGGPAAVALGLRIGVAATTCLVVTEWLHLQEAALSVYSTHLVMVQFPFSAFQKGVERIVGRVAGVLYGLALVQLFWPTPFLFVTLAVLGLLVVFYVYASGRLSYAALNGGLFVGVMAVTGITAPATALPYAVGLIPQLVLGVGAALLVNWVTGAERTVAIVTTGEPLWPLRRDWLSVSAMLTTIQGVTVIVALALDLPALPTVISATMLGISPDLPSLFQKGWLRLLGGMFGGGLALAAMVLLVAMPYFPLLLALVFFGMFLAGYLTKASANYSYAFLQLGLVFPLVLISPTGGIGSIAKAVNRLVGVVVGLLVAELVSVLWPRKAAGPAPAATAVSEGSKTTPPVAAGTGQPG